MYCTACGTQLNDMSNFCSHCGQNAHGQNPSVGSIEQELSLILPVGTPFSAFLAGYLGLFSVFVVPAPFAVIFGIIGLAHLRRSPEQRGALRCWTGIVLGGIFSAIGLFVLIGAFV